MIKRSCLIIDNDDQTEEIKQLVRDAKHQGIDLDCRQFEVGNTAFTQILSSGKIDIDKVEKEAKRRYKNLEFDIIAFDYELDDEDINGVELLRNFNIRRLFRFTPKLVYSGVLDQVLKNIIEPNLDILKIPNEPDRAIIKQKGLGKIKSLIKYSVHEYLDRDDRDSIILKFLKDDIQSTELIVTQALRMYPDFVFENNFVAKKFNGMSYAEVADILQDDDVLGVEFKREIIHQVIAYLTEKI
tara:strand:+ start:4388 stop:5113 length:726 start_codon:yes stop_codon:yes gene_type:complete